MQDGACQHGGEGDIKQKAMLFKVSTGFQSFYLALIRQIHIVPTGEAVFPIGQTLTMSEEMSEENQRSGQIHQFVFHQEHPSRSPLQGEHGFIFMRAIHVPLLRGALVRSDCHIQIAVAHTLMVAFARARLRSFPRMHRHIGNWQKADLVNTAGPINHPDPSAAVFKMMPSWTQNDRIRPFSPINKSPTKLINILIANPYTPVETWPKSCSSVPSYWQS